MIAAHHDMAHHIAFIDHYDSFSENVWSWMSLGLESPWQLDRIYADDTTAIDTCIQTGCGGLLFSPGPGHPQDLIQSNRLLDSLWGRVPILGICLGHQLIARKAGLRIERDDHAHHGSTRRITLSQRENEMWRDIPASFHVATYNSLSAMSDPSNEHRVLARDEYGMVQALGIRNADMLYPAYGFQFHPDSFLSEQSEQLAANAARFLMQTRPRQDPRF